MQKITISGMDWNPRKRCPVEKRGWRGEETKGIVPRRRPQDLFIYKQL
jgi:hypothetical protein